MSIRTPASCADLDLPAVERELIRTGANVSAAAKALGVPVHDLRVLTRTRPRLIEVALEAEEQRLDEAQAALFAVLRGKDMRKRLAAASFILRRTDAGRRRGRAARLTGVGRYPSPQIKSQHTGCEMAREQR
jgi:hypothetical protein